MTLPITSVWGIELPDLGFSVDYPMVREHPENRQLGIRQAQGGVSRLALGPVVALFPMVEANVGLMLALAASFIYLSLPITLLFGFFLYTQPMVTRLLTQFINIFIRTVILHGLMALFLMLLINVSTGGSLMVYLGVIGVGLVGGFFLTRIAAATMKEAMAQSLGAVGSIWLGATTGTLGEGARKPARGMLGAAQLAAAGGTMLAAARTGGLWRSMDMVEATGAGAGRGVSDMAAGGMVRPGTAARMQQPFSRLPDSLTNLTAAPNGAIGQAGTETAAGSNGAGPVLPMRTASPEPNGGSPASTPAPASAPGPTTTPPGPVYSQTGVDEGRPVERWVQQTYRARQSGRGRRQAAETGQALLGEELAQETGAVLSRHGQAETTAVLQATRQTAGRTPPEKLMRAGQLTNEGLELVKSQLDDRTVRAFQGEQGRRDLTVLTAAGLQPRKEATPEEFRQAAAQAGDGQGAQAPGRTVPRALGLDPVAAGAHFAAMNRFARQSEQAGLSPEQRQRLLKEVKAAGATVASSAPGT